MAKIRKRGEGSVAYEKSRKKWRVAFFDNEDNRHYKRFNNEQEAMTFLISQVNAVNNKTFVAPSKALFGRWVIDWLTTYKKDSVKESTYQYYKFLIGYLKPLINVPLQEVTPLQIQQLYKALLKKISANTTHKVHSMLVGIFQKADSLGLIKKNIMASVEAPHFEKKEIEIFTKDEIEKILFTAATHPIFKRRYAAILLGACVGLRKGEILALRRADLFLNTNQIYIRKTVTKGASTFISGSPKTKRSIRKLSIDSELTKELKKVIITLPSWNSEQLIFPTASNHLISPNNFDKTWKAILKAANVEYKKFHTLRHTYATNLLASGEPIVEVSRRLGHAKVAYTLDLYGHAIPDYDKTLVENTKNLYKLPGVSNRGVGTVMGTVKNYHIS